MKVKEIMTTDLVTVSMDDTLETVQEIFDTTAFHHILVVENGKLTGVVSDRDYLRSINPNVGTPVETTRDSSTLQKKVHQIMSRELVILKKDAEIYDAVRLFNNHNISCIPVIDDENRPVGIISWRDILKSLKMVLVC